MLQRREVEAAAAKLGVSLATVDVRTVDEIGAAIQTFVRERASIVVVLASAMFLDARRQIAAFALASRQHGQKYTHGAFSRQTIKTAT